jgi:hypothetical protein
MEGVEMRRARRAALAVGLAAVAVSLTGGPAEASGPPRVAQISFHKWAGATDFTAGAIDGSSLVIGADGALALGPETVAGTDPDGRFNGHAYESGTWTGPWFRPGFEFDELVASWNAATPSGTWIQVQMQEARDKKGERTVSSDWWTMGVWASGDDTINRTSIPHQFSPLGFIGIDTFLTHRPAAQYRVRVTLYRLPGLQVSPSVRQVGAMTSYATANTQRTLPSPLGGAEGIELNVPRLSQEIHHGEYPQYDNGGEAWCSPTSTQMVTEFWGFHPSAEDLAWVDPSYADPQVDFAARSTFDRNYDGAGNWPFNVAYAASYGLSGEVTRLHSLTEAEQFIKAGIPLVASIRVREHQLKGFEPGGSNGHLVVIAGFTATGDVIVNDPASFDDNDVRHVYQRAQFERVWLETRPSEGLVYVIHPASVALPAPIAGEPVHW